MIFVVWFFLYFLFEKDFCHRTKGFLKKIMAKLINQRPSIRHLVSLCAIFEADLEVKPPYKWPEPRMSHLSPRRFLCQPQPSMCFGPLCLGDINHPFNGQVILASFSLHACVTSPQKSVIFNWVNAFKYFFSSLNARDIIFEKKTSDTKAGPRVSRAPQWTKVGSHSKSYSFVRESSPLRYNFAGDFDARTRLKLFSVRWINAIMLEKSTYLLEKAASQWTHRYFLSPVWSLTWRSLDLLCLNNREQNSQRKGIWSEWVCWKYTTKLLKNIQIRYVHVTRFIVDTILWFFEVSPR
jgi:hypothetical protein